MSDATTHAHPAHLWHHFESPQQQFESGKLGMWLFLATEVLMFGGLFCAYAIFRGNHPEIFQYGHRFLDAKWGGINTIVLICSSLTMAWGVRAAQLGQRKLLVAMLALTLLCAFGFLGIKYVEYTHKIQHGLLWGKNYRPEAHLARHGEESAGPAFTHVDRAEATGARGVRPWDGAPEGSSIARAAPAPLGTVPIAGGVDTHLSGAAPRNAHIFFGLYFAMTGLHGIHVIAGMAVIGWLLVSAALGRFGPGYFTPVDLVGLYWHIVDMIWIFLFPLLYLVD